MQASGLPVCQHYIDTGDRWASRVHGLRCGLSSPLNFRLLFLRHASSTKKFSTCSVQFIVVPSSMLPGLSPMSPQRHEFGLRADIMKRSIAFSWTTITPFPLLMLNAIGIIVRKGATHLNSATGIPQTSKQLGHRHPCTQTQTGFRV